MLAYYFPYVSSTLAINIPVTENDPTEFGNTYPNNVSCQPNGPVEIVYLVVLIILIYMLCKN